jgi:hypothetical protein
VTAPESTRTEDPSPRKVSEAGLEAGIIFLMVFVFFCMLFIQGITQGNQDEIDLQQVQQYRDQGVPTAALLRLNEILARNPEHQEALRIKAQVEEERARLAEELAAARQRTDQQARELEQLQTAHRTLQTRSSEMEETVTAAMAEFSRKTARAEADLQAVRDAMATLGRQHEELQARAAELEADRDRERLRVEELRGAYTAVQLRADHATRRAQDAETALDLLREAQAAALARAGELREAGDLVAAGALYRAVLTLDPKHPEALEGLRRCTPPPAAPPPEAPPPDDYF